MNLNIRCKVLRLGSNQLTDRLPPNCVAMKQIEILAVEQNHLNGTLSDIKFSSLERLKCLNLAGNDFSGSAIPVSMEVSTNVG